jgi:hypothetical protein
MADTTNIHEKAALALRHIVRENKDGEIQQIGEEIIRLFAANRNNVQHQARETDQADRLPTTGYDYSSLTDSMLTIEELPGWECSSVWDANGIVSQWELRFYGVLFGQSWDFVSWAVGRYLNNDGDINLVIE